MNAVIDLHKPSIRVAAPAPTAWTSSRSPRHLRTTPEALVLPGSRVVVVAPHPDDEVLALGATIAALARQKHPVLIIAVTDGEGSHPDSRRWTSEALRDIRPHESNLALDRLGIHAEIVRLGLPDGHVPEHEKTLAALMPLGSHDTVFVPWRHDGHADHEACARATLAACRTVGARCIEFPVWALVPSHAAYTGLRDRALQQIDLPPDLAAAKRLAISAFTSQIEPDGDTPAVLQGQALDSWRGQSEWVLA